MKYLSKRVVAYLQHNGIISTAPEDESIYVYGFQTAFYTIFSTVLLILSGMLLDHFFETIILIAIFYTNQTFGGGFHAKSHIKCLFVMITGLLLFIHLHNFYPSLMTTTILICASFAILFSFPLVLHKNKQYLSIHKSQLILRSRISILLEITIIVTYLIFRGTTFIRSISYALCLSAFSRIIGTITILNTRNVQ